MKNKSDHRFNCQYVDGKKEGPGEIVFRLMIILTENKLPKVLFLKEIGNLISLMENVSIRI